MSDMLFIEHNGSRDHNLIANYIRDFIEEEHGIPCEFTIGDSFSHINIFDEEMHTIASFTSKPNKDTLSFYLNMFLDEEK